MEDDYKRESQKGVTAKEDESTESLVSSILKGLIGMVLAMVLFFAWVYYCGEIDRMEHISKTVFYLGSIASLIIGYPVCEYCCKRLKQTLMFMGVVVLVLLSILLVKMIFKG